MKVCVYGTGAVGGGLIGRLHKGGAEVSAVARGAMLDAIRSKGLVVRTTIDEQAVEEPVLGRSRVVSSGRAMSG